MIERKQIPRLLIEASPTFARGRAAWTWDWHNSRQPPLYLLISEFVRHLTTLNARGRRKDFPRVFELVESMLREGDPYVRELARVGFLEDLQDTSYHRTGSRTEDFLPYLQSASKRAWQELETFWREDAR